MSNDNSELILRAAGVLVGAALLWGGLWPMKGLDGSILGVVLAGVGLLVFTAATGLMGLVFDILGDL
jgi:hypothetical protein